MCEAVNINLQLGLWLHLCGWEDNIKIDLEVVGYRGMKWIELAQNKDRWLAPVNVVMNLRVQ